MLTYFIIVIFFSSTRNKVIIIAIIPKSFLGIIPKASQTKFHQMQITKSKVTDVQIPVTKWEKKKKWGKRISGLQNEAIRKLQIGAGFRDYKSEQEGLQIEAALGISNWGKKITNRSSDLKSGQRDLKSGQKLQIGT